MVLWGGWLSREGQSPEYEESSAWWPVVPSWVVLLHSSHVRQWPIMCGHHAKWGLEWCTDTGLCLRSSQSSWSSESRCMAASKTEYEKPHNKWDRKQILCGYPRNHFWPRWPEKIKTEMRSARSFWGRLGLQQVEVVGADWHRRALFHNLVMIFVHHIWA